MPLIHNAIARSAIGRAFRDLFGLDDESEGVERLGETLTPTADIFGMPESGFLRNERLCWCGIGTTAAAGVLSWAAIRNPFGSRFLAVLEWFTCDNSGTNAEMATYILGSTGATPGTAAVPQVRDLRWSVRPIVQVAYGSDFVTAWPGALLVQAQNMRADGYLYKATRGPVVLGPGTAVIAVCASANQAFRFSVGWRERPALPGELRGVTGA